MLTLYVDVNVNFCGILRDCDGKRRMVWSCEQRLEFVAREGREGERERALL